MNEGKGSTLFFFYLQTIQFEGELCSKDEIVARMTPLIGERYMNNHFTTWNENKPAHAKGADRRSIYGNHEPKKQEEDPSILKKGEQKGTKSQSFENIIILKQSKTDLRITLRNWKNRERKRKIYRCSVVTALLLCCMSLCKIGYEYLYEQVPSVIRFVADSQQSLNLNLPMEGEVVSVSGQGEASWERQAITIDLNREVTLTTGSSSHYEMDVKLFGFLPFKKVDIQIIDDQELIPVGVTVGIYVKTDGILVVDVGEFDGANKNKYAPSKYIIQPGDYILKANGAELDRREDFISMVENSKGEEIILTIKRGEEVMDVKVTPKLDQGGAYK
ncbi:MAG: hypothetical protein LBM60_07255, partial [Clostridium sp.]|nr:hypothetical protein [Clostridium sp.]